MSLFNSLLETAEPPKDKRRFAQIGRSLLSEGVIDSCEGSVIYSRSQEQSQEQIPVQSSLDDATHSQPLAHSASEPIRGDDCNSDKVDSEHAYGYEDDVDQFDATVHDEELQQVEIGDTISPAPATNDAAP